MTDHSLEFDWRSSESIIVRQQDSIAVYTNPYGQAVIRRERAWDEEDDVCIVIGHDLAVVVAHAILRAAGMGDIEFVRPCGGGYGDVPIDYGLAAQPKDKTAAERSKRYRRKRRQLLLEDQRDGHRDEAVTVANGHALQQEELAV